MSNKAIKCEQCGAPLDPRGHEAWVECPYCGGVHERASKRPPPGASGTGGAADPDAGSDAVGGVPAWIWVGLGMVLVVTLISVVVAVGISSPSGGLLPFFSEVRVETRGRLPASPPRLSRRLRARPDPVTWRTHGTCPVDADGDDIGDVASMVWSTRHKDRLTIVSGKDGQILWQGRSLKQNTPFYCVGGGWLAVELPGFRVELVHARSPKKKVTLRLRDEVSRVGVGQGCVTFATADGSRASYRLPEGRAGRCRPPELRRARSMYHGVIQRHQRRGTVRRGAIRYVVRMRRRGTPMLTVTARRGRRRLWRKELDLRASSYGTALALAKDRLLVFGVDPAKEKQGVLLALDPSTGTKVYSRELTHESSQALAYWSYNGKWLLLASWIGLHAFDPATGRRAWSIGR
jgi:hypothetical protein